MEQGGILSCLLCNVYMDNRSLQLHRQSICHSAGNTVEHMQTTSKQSWCRNEQVYDGGSVKLCAVQRTG